MARNDNGGGCLGWFIIIAMIGGVLSAIWDAIVENSTFFIIILAVIVFCGIAFWISGAFSKDKSEKIDLAKENRELKEQNFKLDSQVYQLEKDNGILLSRNEILQKQLQEKSKQVVKPVVQVIEQKEETIEEKFKKEIEYKTELENKIKYLKEEIQSLENQFSMKNDKMIAEHYNFKEYEKYTSEDIKTQLQLLDVEEIDLRKHNNDIIYDGCDDRVTYVNRLIKKVLRTFNAECAIACSKITSKNIDKIRSDIQKSFNTINELYKNEDVYISKDFLELKLEQAKLMYTVELKKQQERDIQRAIREKLKEIEVENKKLADQQKQIDKDLQHHIQERNRTYKWLRNAKMDAEKEMYLEKIRELEEKIHSLEDNKKEIKEWIDNAKAGFVYVISNVGAFGEDIYKIGMTRRSDPLERIHELSSASVPFEFDVHATIFSSDAPSLENALHKEFADRAVNKVNPRKEFFKVSLDEIEDFVKANYDETVIFNKKHEALQYHQSLQMEEDEFMFWGN